MKYSVLNLLEQRQAASSDALREFALKCEAKQPGCITSTKLRKQLATLAQTFILKDNSQEILATFEDYLIVFYKLLKSQGCCIVLIMAQDTKGVILTKFNLRKMIKTDTQYAGLSVILESLDFESESEESDTEDESTDEI
ncbi:hypothetical protein KUTeg_005687 [Tegillarca granosa]|uniref:Uncharacterized protein n=1 Tax=Tegillarca granosa TaxID=220873 RepID=A0ABQ9FJC1_TEGGR|nr:hypothetical protein KUTeg_005687 [Tegillarca granosa]